MKKQTSKIAALGLALVMALGLTACGGGLTTDDAKAYIQGIMDMTYLGQYNDEYIKLVNGTKEECEQNYLGGLEVEAEYFAYYFDSELTDAVKDDLIQLYKDIYSHSSYTIKDATRASDGGFTVTVEVQPIDIMEKVREDDALWEFVDDFNARNENGEFAEITDEEYETIWLKGIIEIVRSHLDTIGYLDTKSIVVQIQADDSGVFGLNDDDFNNLDTIIISYP